jgi:hypothetical protein
VLGGRFYDKLRRDHDDGVTGKRLRARSTQSLRPGRARIGRDRRETQDSPVLPETVAHIDLVSTKPAQALQLPEQQSHRAGRGDRYHLASATLTQYKIEADGDIHLVVKTPLGRTVIAEAPNPSCVGCTSPLKAKITTVRTTFKERAASDHIVEGRPRAVRLDGIGFLDELHGQTGVAPNGIEVHPLFGIAIP